MTHPLDETAFEAAISVATRAVGWSMRNRTAAAIRAYLSALPSPRLQASEEDVEAVARAIDPEAWADDYPIPTRADVLSFHERRQASCKAARAALSAVPHGGSEPPLARPLDEWHEDMGDVLWWEFPITEAPWVGSPLCLGQTIEVHAHSGLVARVMVGGWPGYHTHWTPLPPIPAPPSGERA